MNPPDDKPDTDVYLRRTLKLGRDTAAEGKDNIAAAIRPLRTLFSADGYHKYHKITA